MFGIHTKPVVTRHPQTLRRRCVWVVDSEQYLANSCGNPFALLVGHVDNRRPVTIVASPHMTAVVSDANASSDLLQRRFVRSTVGRAMVMLTTTRAVFVPGVSLFPIMFDAELFSAMQTRMVDTIAQIKLVVDLNVAVRAQQFKPFRKIMNFLWIGVPTLPLSSVDMMKVQGA